MRLFADHCVPTDVVQVLRHLQFQVVRAYEVGLARADDETLFTYARTHGYVFVTVDRDFGNIVRFAITKSHGVILIELEGLSKSFVQERLHGFFRALRPRTVHGRLVIVKPANVKIWPKTRGL